MTKIIREKPETKAFRQRILKAIGKKKMSAYDITKILGKKEDADWRKLYKRVMDNLKALETQGKVVFAGEDESGGGSIPKRLWRRK
jgi:DNA-binding PadR family transcriptional regulator